MCTSEIGQLIFYVSAASGDDSDLDTSSSSEDSALIIGVAVAAVAVLVILIASIVVWRMRVARYYIIARSVYAAICLPEACLCFASFFKPDVCEAVIRVIVIDVAQHVLAKLPPCMTQFVNLHFASCRGVSILNRSMFP